MYEPEWKTEWIDEKSRLIAIGAELGAAKLLTIDTETAGWQTGNERLCLIQIGIPDRAVVYVFDMLALEDPRPLEAVLSATTPQLLAHNAAFEERQFDRYGMKLRGVIDTLNLARKLRPDLPNHTLRTCCKLLLNIEMSKEEQTSDWTRRPLTESQLRYASLDAELVYKVYRELAALETRLELDASLPISLLMAELTATVRSRIDLTREIATELAFLNGREQVIRDAIRAKLIAGEEPYEGEFGTASVTRVKRTEVSPEKVRTEFPSIAELVISEYVERERLKLMMKEHGIDDKRMNAVLDIVGYNDRLNLSLKKVV